jgi:ABC-type transport system substrate-binding protein
MAILPETVDEASLTTEAVGTGPFRPVNSSASGISLTAFDGYWGQAPTVDDVTFRLITEPTAALTALTTGPAQWTDNVPPQQVEKLSDDRPCSGAARPATAGRPVRSGRRTFDCWSAMCCRTPRRPSSRPR